MHDDYKRLTIPEGTVLEPCPCCGHTEPQLWQYSESETAPTTKAIMCPHQEPIGPRDGIKNEGCMLYMPPDDFYRETIRDAVRYWNEHAIALRTIRELRNGQQPTT